MSIEQIQQTYVTGDPRDLTLLDRNARYMTYEQFKRLVDNVRADGCLTSTPFVWFDRENLRRVVLSGNHRVKAAIEVGLPEIGWLETEQPLPHQRRLALQLSHNAVEGQDDPAVLKDLFDELENLEWREYAGLDDKTLELLGKVDVGSLNEANLEYATVQVVFLPHELEEAKQALNEATEIAKYDERWTSIIGQHTEMLEALDTARNAGGVQNTATALAIILEVFNAHLTELRDYWYDPEQQEPRRGKALVPLETIIGTRSIPGDAAAIIAQAVEKMTKAGDLGKQQWRALELLAADYLAGPTDE